MRRKFGKLINELAKKDDKIVLLVGDIGYGIFDDFRKNHPKKFSTLEFVTKFDWNCFRYGIGRT